MIWNSLRFKPPPSSTDETCSLGWRIEFRPMELQMNDFENAALVVFLSLLTRTILSYRIDLRIPISFVQENMERAQIRNTIKEKKFYFSRNIFHSSNQNQIDEMTLNEIINGSVSINLSIYRETLKTKRNHFRKILLV